MVFSDASLLEHIAIEGQSQAQDLTWMQAKRHRNMPTDTSKNLLHPILLRIAFSNMLKQANL